MKTCLIEGCEKRVHARGWCSMHYWRWKHYGDVNYERAQESSECKIEDCDKPRDRRGFCTHHYTQDWKYGNPLHNGREKQTVCKIESCDEPRSEKISTLILCEDHLKEYWAERKPRSYQNRKEVEIRETLERRETDPQAYLQYMKEYGERPKVKARRLEREQQRRIEDPSKHRSKSRRRGHLRRGTPGTYTPEQLQDRIDFYGRRCYLCGCDWDALPCKADAKPKERWKTIDHVIPCNKGGTGWPANLRPACNVCNSIKHDADLDSLDTTFAQ